MAKLTDSQLIVLSKAVARQDGAAVVPPKINKAAAAKIGKILIGRKLMREINIQARHADLACGRERSVHEFCRHACWPQCDRHRQGD